MRGYRLVERVPPFGATIRENGLEAFQLYGNSEYSLWDFCTHSKVEEYLKAPAPTSHIRCCEKRSPEEWGI